MKNAFIGLMLLATVPSYAGTILRCKLPSLGWDLTIQKNQATNAYKYTVKTKYEDAETSKIVEVKDLNRSRFQIDKDLYNVMIKSGLGIENFINATAYITNDYSLGRSGLMVFKGGRNTPVKMAFFNGAVDYVEVCK